MKRIMIAANVTTRLQQDEQRFVPNRTGKKCRDCASVLLKDQFMNADGKEVDRCPVCREKDGIYQQNKRLTHHENKIRV